MHTPGPWFIHHTFNVMGGIDGRRGVANTGTSYDGRLPDGGYAESEANTHLIAAAPRMLAALEGFDRLSLVIESAVRNCDPTRQDAIRNAIVDGRAAIKAARGER